MREMPFLRRGDRRERIKALPKVTEPAEDEHMPQVCSEHCDPQDVGRHSRAESTGGGHTALEEAPG